MNRSFLLVTVCAAWSGVRAQPNLTLGTQQPAVGQVYVNLSSAALPPGISGPNQTYDFTTASTSSGPGFTYVTPSTAPGAAYFPAATACSDNDGTAYTYQQYTNQGAFELGVELPGLGRTVYTDPMQFLKFPLTLNTSWTDSYQGSSDLLGNTGTISGSLSAIADGYGTLQLPWGDVPNVLRVRVERNETAVVFGITTTVQMVFHYYLRSGIAVPVAQRLTRTTTGPGGTQVDESLNYLTEASVAVGLMETMVELPVRIAPVPAHDRLLVSVSDGVILTVEVIDASGRDVAVPRPASGARELLLDVAAWARGPYVLRVVASDGRVAVRTIAVH